MLVLSFNSVLIIAAISVLVPVELGLLPRVPVPGAVLMVVAGIIVGPSVLGWARIDAPVQVLAQLGLGMLLFLAGLEIDVDRLRGPLSRLAGEAFVVSAIRSGTKPRSTVSSKLNSTKRNWCRSAPRRSAS